MIKFIILFILLNYSSYTNTKTTEQTTVEESEENVDEWGTTTLQPKFTFDGVDYDSLPDKFRKEHYNCYGHYNRCIMNVAYFQGVCAIGNSTSWSWSRGHYGTNWWPAKEFVTNCAIHLRNCLFWEDAGYDIYGTDVEEKDGSKHPLWSFQGEGIDCEKSVV